ncbi:MAG: FeoC-like transcriptional regulator [Sedimenticola sp.]|uniref:Sugar metabolism transcriptional regulator n=1 Tax=Sedimenticola thiotaurini TaxID=1543721 RepID=A0A558DEZ3_9GAMM|nr:FeoC-like transcriptional regulator [Sedimenticola sp.]TVT59608.1 MAG: sugar metabolism transcriptional regulator [Sedimenticola thiotaurini]MCW8882989.1 FeoC-like transcriptional regulator [Sedimenticola sp.]MCW8921310.1 FeoC-like transcriptional regulator [Sedimenticola sp.]MCW8947301.1 FeoC-like transcriptional regulator [Sedimenticola sp.]
MILSDIRRYMEQRQQVCLSDIALHFGASQDATRGMLETWIRKGKVRRLASMACGSSCGKCPEAQIELYEWIGDRPQQ